MLPAELEDRLNDVPALDDACQPPGDWRIERSPTRLATDRGYAGAHYFVLRATSGTVKPRETRSRR